MSKISVFFMELKSCDLTDEYPKSVFARRTRSSWAGFPDGSVVKSSPANAGDEGLTPGSGRSPEGGHDNPLQYSCLENPVDRGAWQATDHGIAKSWT